MDISKVMSKSRSVAEALSARLRWTGAAFSVVVALAAMTTHANAATIGEAVDATNLVWTTGGNTNWFYQAAITHDGVDAAQSGAIGNSQSTWIQTSVTGPGTLSFWWQVSSELAGDILYFYLDGAEIDGGLGSAISGENAGWERKTVSITNGTHTLRWQYSKDGSGLEGSDCGWVDQVAWTPVPYYTVLANEYPALAGSTTGSGSYLSNTTCTVTATANSGYAFASWTEGTNVWNFSTNYTFTVVSNTTATANFTPINYAIDTSSSPTTGGSTSGGGPKAFGDSCTVVAQANPWYTFAKWTEGTNDVSLSSSYNFTVEGARTLVAHFTPYDFTISTSPSPVAGGTTSGEGQKAYGSTCTLIAIPNPGFSFEKWTEGSFEHTTTNYTFVVTTNRTLVANFLYVGTLGDAVDAPELIWTTGGDAGYPVVGTTNWYPQTITTHDGVDAAQSGTISDSGTSWMQTTVTGPGTLSFRWKVSSDTGWNFLRFTIDDVEQLEPISGEVDWQPKTYSLPAGNHALKWAYTKGPFGIPVGLDCGWVDQVVWTGGSVTDPMPLYRFWSARYHGHFYTISEGEKNNLIANLSRDWAYEGIAYYTYGVAIPDTVPVYRFWSARYRGHFYTTSEGEKNNLIANLSRDWAYEGIAYYAYPTAVPESMPVFRFWSSRYRHHFYTISEAEKNNIIANLSQDWTYEGIAYYAFTTANARAFARSAILRTADDVTGEIVSTAEPSSFDLESALATSDGQTDAYGDVVFPLSYPGRDVAAYVYDSLADAWQCVLETTNSPSLATFTGILLDRSYRFEVFARDPNSDMAVSVHRSWFEMQLDAPTQLNDSSQPTLAEDGVGSPVARIKTPAEDGFLTVKLYSSSQGVMQTLTEVAGGEAVDLTLPEGNCWYWIGGWRASDNALVLSFWLRHQTEE